MEAYTVYWKSPYGGSICVESFCAETHETITSGQTGFTESELDEAEKSQAAHLDTLGYNQKRFAKDIS